MKSFFKGLLLAVGMTALASCGAASKIASESTQTTQSQNTTAGVSSTLDTVASDLTPDSLEKTSAASDLSKQQTTESGNPCAAVNNDLYACQPILLRIYLDLAKTLVRMAKEIVDDVGNHLGNLPDGSSGSATEGNQVIQYSKTSDTQFAILISVSGKDAGYISVADTAITMKMKLAHFAEAGEGAPDAIEMGLTYTDKNSWSATIFLAGFSCKTDDPRAPERIHVAVTKQSSLWKGKAMFYNGRWLGDSVSCSTAESDDRSMNFYTDFVANDVAARASVYLMPRNKSSLADIENWGMDSFGTNFMGQTNQTAYANPYCNRASNLTALWKDTCSSIDATIASTSYGPASEWIVPSEFYQKTITVPSSL